MKKSDCLCYSCTHWVNCGWQNGKPLGFCILKDLYTYTCKSTDECCMDFDKGENILLKDWEEENNPRFG